MIQVVDTTTYIVDDGTGVIAVDTRPFNKSIPAGIAQAVVVGG